MNNNMMQTPIRSILRYWITILLAIIVNCIGAVLIDKYFEGSLRLTIICCWASIFVSIIIYANTRRCHDLGVSAWQMFHPCFWVRMLFKS